ncbi:MAG: ribosome-binding factor A [Saprospiraceae bacterium]|nr:ribosome-binding factor A [Saprospiraceae bacterium]
METKRQGQVAELIKRNFSIVLQEEGSYIFGREPLVTVTNVKMSPDLGLAKIYVSVYNVLDKQTVVLEIEEQIVRLRQSLAHKIKKFVRRIPDISVYLDDTIDEIYKIADMFQKLDEDDQLGKRRTSAYFKDGDYEEEV